MSEADRHVVRVLVPAGPRIEHTDAPRTLLAVHARATQDRHRNAVRIEADATRIEELHAPRRADVEQAARLEKELAFLRKERWESGEIDDLLVRFDLREIRVQGEVRRQRWRDAD